MPVLESWLSHRLLVWASSARSVRSRLSGRAGHLRSASLLFGHGAAAAYYSGAGGICVDKLEFSASVHDVKIAVLFAVPPCHRSVACRIHGIGAIKVGGVICSSQSGDPVRVKGAGRGCKRDETDETAREEVRGGSVNGARAPVPAFASTEATSLAARLTPPVSGRCQACMDVVDPTSVATV